MKKNNYFVDAEIEAGKLRDKSISGSAGVWKMIAMPVIYALLSIADTLRDKSMDKGKVMVTEKFPAGVTVFEEEEKDE